MPNIAIVWDFDGTLTPQDTTTKVVEILEVGRSGNDFWNTVKRLRGDERKPKWEHVLASDAPIWMYALSRIAFAKGVPLNTEFFENFVRPHILLYDLVPAFLRKLKLVEETARFKSVGLKIHYFIITAGLKDLVELLLPPDLIKWTFGCRYEIVAPADERDRPESIPVFCMDETMKTRSLFEISKGSFEDRDKSVNKRVPVENRWAPFENMIYIGDGDTDVPALSLVRSQGGLGVAVYDPAKSKEVVDRRLKQMRLDKRADLITPADFSEKSELFEFLRVRCTQIAQRYRAEQSV
ncbi:MAG: HAD family hydrolase [Rhizomicrobium sp.]|jgi:phosphoserine phosphatase